MPKQSRFICTYDEKMKSAVWSGREEPVELVELDRRGHSTAEDMNSRDPKLFYVNNQLRLLSQAPVWKSVAINPSG